MSSIKLIVTVAAEPKFRSSAVTYLSLGDGCGRSFDALLQAGVSNDGVPAKIEAKFTVFLCPSPSRVPVSVSQRRVRPFQLQVRPWPSSLGLLATRYSPVE